jgi:phage gp36-like protein
MTVYASVENDRWRELIVAVAALTKAPSLPAWLFDFKLLSALRRINAKLYSMTPEALEQAADEDFEKLEAILTDHLAEITNYLRARQHLRFKLVSAQSLEQERKRYAEAVYTLSRGYAPGHLPSREDRMQVAAETLNSKIPTNA